MNLSKRQYNLSAPQRYGLAVGIFLIALTLRFVLPPIESGLQFLIFYPAMVLTFAVCGIGSGILFTVLSTVASYFIFFPPPYYSFERNEVGEIAIISFLFSAYLITKVIGQPRDANIELSSETLSDTNLLDALLASEESFRIMADCAPVLLWIAGLDKGCYWFNKVWLDFTGRTLEQETGNGWADGVHPDDFERCLDIYISHFDRREEFRMEYRLRRHDGVYRWIDDHGAPTFDSKGNFSGYIGSCIDISDMKENEQDLIAAKQKSEQLAQAKSEFLSNMSHEIRTPMNAILGFSELALQEEFPTKAQDYFTKINESSNHLLTLLNDILTFSKLDVNSMTLNLAAFNLESLQTQLKVLFLDLNERNNNRFTIDLAPDVPHFLIGDFIRLKQILINLLSNATKFTENGVINLYISLQHQDAQQARLLFCVSDTGIGIPEADKEKILHPFTQANESITRRFGGTGLGLSISQSLLNLMGSELSIDSTLGVGSQFYFELVLNLSSESEVALSQKPAEINVINRDEFNRYIVGFNILIAEDNVFNQQVIQGFLELAGVTITIANNGAEALDALTKADYDLVLMDINMPIMDGYTASQEIKRQPRYATLPIIALSAAVTKDEQEHCFAAGMIDFIEKPIVPAKLIATITRHVKPKAQLSAIEASAESAPISDSQHLSTASHNETRTDLDFHVLKEIVGDDLAKITTYLKYFLENATEVSKEIIEAINTELAQDAGKAGHKLKSSAYTVGAIKIGDLCLAIEVAGKADDMTTLKQLLPDFEEEWRLYQVAINAWLNSN